MPDWPLAYSQGDKGQHITARIRATPEDFQVDEQLGLAPDGAGEHLLLHIRKRLRNTDQVARQLAHHAGVRVRDIGYCGLKDRTAITTQWFSIWLPGKADPDWTAIEDENLKVIEQVRHGRKLQRGALQANHFHITLREVSTDQETVESRIEQIKQQGVPNYFGEQRFGRDGGNLIKAEAMFKGKRIKDRHLRSLYLSSARSYLFNQVLAARITASTWNSVLPGEAVMLSGSRSYFICDEVDDDINRRLSSGDIHPSGPLWGKGELPATGDVENLERNIVSAYPLFCDGLEKAGMKQERRSLRLMVSDLTWSWPEERVLQLVFSLPAGSFATSVLREICDFS